jgi:hypothetical protein
MAPNIPKHDMVGLDMFRYVLCRKCVLLVRRFLCSKNFWLKPALNY